MNEALTMEYDAFQFGEEVDNEDRSDVRDSLLESIFLPPELPKGARTTPRSATILPPPLQHGKHASRECDTGNRGAKQCPNRQAGRQQTEESFAKIKLHGRSRSTIGPISSTTKKATDDTAATVRAAIPGRLGFKVTATMMVSRSGIVA